MFIRLLPAILSLVVLAAHFSRAGSTVAVVLLLGCVALLWIRRPWAAYAIQTILVLGVIVWVLTAIGIAQARIQNGEGWLRMAMILGGVALFTAYSSWHFRHPRLRAWFGTDQPAREEPNPDDPPAVDPS